MNENILSLRKYDISKYAEIILIILVTLGLFLVPLFIPRLLETIFGAKSVISMNSQYIVGTIVNTCLIVTAINIKGWKKIIGIVTAPSLAAMAGGMIFPLPATIFTFYMIPAMWIGNFAIIYLYKYLFIKKNINYAISAGAGVLLKAAIIFGGFSLMTLVASIPEKIANILSVTMGVNQLITATIR